MPDDLPTRAPRREFLAAAWRAIAAVAGHAVYAGVHFSQYFYRTPVFSRVLVSTVLGLAANRLLARGGALRIAGFALVALFTGFGVAGGIERQNFYLSEWRRHRHELLSLLDDTPRLVPGTDVVLLMDRTSPAFHATRAPYLAASWAHLLWGPAVMSHVLMWSAEQGTGCRAEDAGLVCWASSEERDAIALGTSKGIVLPWNRLLLFDFEPGEWRYRVAASFDGSRPAYDAPRASQKGHRSRSEHLLAGDRLLGKFLPERPLDRRERGLRPYLSESFLTKSLGRRLEENRTRATACTPLSVPGPVSSKGAVDPVHPLQKPVVAIDEKQWRRQVED